jgi:magnesium transporter
MLKFVRHPRRSRKTGMPPGSLVLTDETQARLSEPVRVTRYVYGPSLPAPEGQDLSLATLTGLEEPPGVSWINIDGLHDIATIRAIGERFNIHPLVLEDILNTDQRPKMETYDAFLYLVLKMIYLRNGADGEPVEAVSEQVSIVLTRNTVLTFQELPLGDAFDAVRHRLSRQDAQLMGHGADFLAYSLLDAIVDHYFSVMEHLGEQIDAIEETLLDEDGEASRQRDSNLLAIHRIRRQLLLWRRLIWPLRDTLASLSRVNSPFLTAETQVYLRDVLDHVLHIADTLEVYRDEVLGLFDLYLSALNTRINNIMKLLAIISTLFIPLTFIVGVYGMNFKYMPELNAPYGYPAVWAFMAMVSIGMLMYFRRQRWL